MIIGTKTDFENLADFILPEFFEHVYLFCSFLICEKYYTLGPADIILDRSLSDQSQFSSVFNWAQTSER